MSDTYRRERIERLLRELEYEITRGMMEQEIDETLSFEFYVPVSQKNPNGVVHCSFRTRPTNRFNIMSDPPRLKIVGKDVP